MKKAYKQDTLIDLETYGHEGLQSVYDDGQKGMLACSVCRQAVKLYLGIVQEPSFFHSNHSQDCTESMEVSLSSHDEPKEDAYIERNGFRVPISRSITQTAVIKTLWKPTSRIKDNPPFRSADKEKGLSSSSYLKQLRESGIELDAQQTEAVSAIEGPVLVLSGAGSGKTRVLTVRTALMLTELNIDPASIMLVTFTAKASREMKDRLNKYPGLTAQQINRLVCGTFHSIFYRILLFHEPQRWNKESLLKREWEKEHIIKLAGKERNLDEKEFPFDSALQQIGLWKNSLLFPEDIKPEDDWEEKCAFLYKRYEEYKNQHHKYDFDDMLIGCYSLLKSSPDILDFYRSRFKYFLIDEFQDINTVQYELIKLLSSSTRNICAVGDDDQSIYAFRGSSPEFILHFERDFEGANVIKLTNNYRSAHEIVSTANRIITRNKNRLEKKMSAQHNNGAPPVLFFPFDEEQEATMIVTDLKERITRGENPGDFAILYRTHSMSRAIFERLAHSNLPFVIDQDAESFYSRRMVKGMLAFLKLSLDPDDTEAAADILPSLFLKQNVLQQIKAQSILNDCSLLTALSEVKTGFAFQEKKLKMLPDQVRRLKDVKPSIALEMVEKDLGYQDFVKKRGNEGSSAEKGSDDVRDLKVAARRFQTARELLDHADHMRAMNTEVKKLSKHFHNAIQLTTIHRAKGLEYGKVYILGNVDGGLPHDYSLDSYRKGDPSPLEEERRLLYVAATRAKDELFLSVPETRRGKTAAPSRFLQGLNKK
ncbi:DNA helicase-2/ATP-dependent DNA helicase PcrA [Peribacillus deserti]|uniref:DNA 3'-5' helicase n=1 Tax=Peribacillus deserti TaxID=673318 RepID=A0ABS2QLA7_9BACI|nr:ATP-dependent helicase [Peribacillus deserti]MBM7693026.1 DNA helicase-2/ATP-dependent DNA helicase PcrA [Peribacillus deserti]